MSNRLIRTIAWWEIACGVAGILMFAALYLEMFTNSRVILDMMGPINYWGGVAFFSFVIAAGRALLKQQAWGLRASSVCQALQVFSFAFLNGPHVQILAGPLVGLKFASNYWMLTFGFNSSFFLGTRVSGPGYEITINVLAAVWTGLLVREWLRTNQPAQPAAA